MVNIKKDGKDFTRIACVINGLNLLATFALSPISREQFAEFLAEQVKTSNLKKEAVSKYIELALEYIEKLNNSAIENGCKVKKIDYHGKKNNL